MFGFYKIALAAPKLTLANPKKNLESILTLIKDAKQNSASIILFSELTLIGYTVGDLLFQERLLRAQKDALERLCHETQEINTVIVVGYALLHQNRLYNTAAVLQNGKILAFVPKSFIPNKQEFYESRYFVSAQNIKESSINFFDYEVPFGVDLLFSDAKDLTFGIEICEDLWAVTPPSNQLAINGANLILNLSASNEVIGKATYRRELVRNQSARTSSVYAYASSSLGESSTDTIFGGDLIVSEYGSIIAQDSTLSFENKILYACVDLQRVSNLRRSDSSFSQSKPTEHRVIQLRALDDVQVLDRFI
ncbi:MAG TPA: NAD(+) synthase, partial [Nitratifractor sp.]|nr:NAD(+) synthase [Nitratifractor sp.]